MKSLLTKYMSADTSSLQLGFVLMVRIGVLAMGVASAVDTTVVSMVVGKSLAADVRAAENAVDVGNVCVCAKRFQLATRAHADVWSED